MFDIAEDTDNEPDIQETDELGGDRYKQQFSFVGKYILYVISLPLVWS